MTTTTANAAKSASISNIACRFCGRTSMFAPLGQRAMGADRRRRSARARPCRADRRRRGGGRNENLPTMGAIETKVLGGVKARIFRLSFSGELASRSRSPPTRARLWRASC